MRFDLFQRLELGCVCFGVFHFADDIAYESREVVSKQQSDFCFQLRTDGKCDRNIIAPVTWMDPIGSGVFLRNENVSVGRHLVKLDRCCGGAFNFQNCGCRNTGQFQEGCLNTDLDLKRNAAFRFKFLFCRLGVEINPVKVTAGTGIVNKALGALFLEFEGHFAGKRQIKIDENAGNDTGKLARDRNRDFDLVVRIVIVALQERDHICDAGTGGKGHRCGEIHLNDEKDIQIGTVCIGVPFDRIIQLKFRTE